MMMKKEWLVLVVGAIAFLILPAFQQETTKDRIQIEVEKKLKNYRQVEERKCRKKMFEQANFMADSILMVRSRSKAIDTLVKPPIPPRPDRPEILYPKDSTPLAPFLNKDTLPLLLSKDTIND